MSSPIDLSGFLAAKAIPLANPAQPKDQGTALVTGWGDTTEGGHTSTTLQGTRVALRLDAACTHQYGAYYVAARTVCAGGGSPAQNNPDTCQGDSGGPLVLDVDPDPNVTTFVLLGITSYGYGCGRKDIPAAYTWTQGSGIASFLDAASYQTSAVRAGGDTDTGTPGARSGGSSTGGGGGSSAGGSTTGTTAAISAPPAPQTPTPAPVIATRDTTRPTARLSKLSCTRKRRCTFRIRAADRGGRVARLSARLTRRVKVCKRTRSGARKCRYVTRTKKLRPKRIRGGYTMTGTLRRATYKLTAVATDHAGNRSRKLTKKFRVRR